MLALPSESFDYKYVQPCLPAGDRQPIHSITSTIMSNGKGLRDSASILIGQNKQTITVLLWSNSLGEHVLTDQQAIVDSIEELQTRQNWLEKRVREIASSIPDSNERNGAQVRDHRMMRRGFGSADNIANWIW